MECAVRVPEGEGPTMDGEMLAFDPPSLMEMRWGDELLRFELRSEGDGSVLEFTNVFDELGKAAATPLVGTRASTCSRSTSTIANRHGRPTSGGSRSKATTRNGSVRKRRRSDRPRSGRRPTATAE